MSRRGVPSLQQYLRRAAGPPDAELLRQFRDADDQQAFAALLDRHGPMVLGTARRLTANTADADDVFQAVFLSLARLAKSIRRGQSLPNWLYTTTCRTAARARRRRAASLEGVPDPTAAATAEADLAWREVRAALDEELHRLPERLRSPLLLCYLSGLTRDEAAERLGLSLSTLKRRLEEGRTALRRRLEARGVSAAGLALAVLSPAGLDAAVRPTLATSCLAAVAGEGPAAGVSALLTPTTTLKGLAMKAVIASVTLVGLGVGIYTSGGRAGPPEPVAEKKAAGPAAAAKRVDALGDPLPDGAVARLGTRRHHDHKQTWPWQHRPVSWQPWPDGKSYLVLHRGVDASEVRRIDSESGGVVDAWSVAKSRGPLAWAKQDDAVVGFSPDGRHVLFTNEYVHHGEVDHTQEWHLTLYDLAARKPAWSVSKQREPKEWPDLGRCVFSANGRWFVTAGHGNDVVRLWEAGTGTQLWEHRGKGQSLSPIGFANDDATVVLRGDDGDVHLFDRATGTERKSFPTARPRSWGQNLLSPDGKHLILCTAQPPSVWDLDGQKVAVLEGHKSWANVAAFSPDGKKLYTGSYDAYVVEREWPLGKPVRTIELGRDRVQRMAVSPDGTRLDVVFEGEQALCSYDLKTGTPRPEPTDGHRSTVYGVECAPDGTLVTFGSDRSVRTWDAKEGKVVAQFAVELDLNGRGFALSADGRRVAVPNYDVKSVGIYDRGTGNRLRTIPADHVGNQHLVFSPDGRFLAGVGRSNRAAQVWRVDTGATVLKVKAERTGNSVAGGFSPDGRTFAFGDGDRIRFWDTATWKEAEGMPAVSPWGFAGLTFSPDGRMIATTSAFGDGVRLYEVATRRQRAHVESPGATTDVLRFSHDGRLLAWVNDHRTVHVLDVRTGGFVGSFTGHDAAVTGLAFTTDDKVLASSSDDCTVLVWDVAGTPVARPAPDRRAAPDGRALRGEDAATAFAAVRKLAADPEAALKVAADRLRPAEPLDPDWVAARLRDLDHPTFAERDRATRELEQIGDRAAAALEKFLAATPSVEARDRAEKLLAKVRRRPAAGEAAEALRVLEALEWIGSARAKGLVEKLATGAEGVSLTEEAKRSLRRWRTPAE